MMATGETWPPAVRPSKTEWLSHWTIDRILDYAGWQRPDGEYVLWNHIDRFHNPPSKALVGQAWLNESANTTAATQ